MRSPSKLSTRIILPAIALTAIVALQSALLFSRAIQTSEASNTAATVHVTVAAGLVLLVLIATVRFARSTDRRIGVLASQMQDLADTQLEGIDMALTDFSGQTTLPAPLQVVNLGNDQIGEVATAINDMDDAMLRSAERQLQLLNQRISDLVVKLSHRTRSLVDSQLSVIDELKRTADDPVVLKHCFKIDHLATRMRRNAESVLVLAQAVTHRPHSDPVAVDDVVGVAVSEIEDYQRIQVNALQPTKIKGSVVIDVAHLLAEILDNAADFSAPETQIQLTGRQTGDGYLLTVTDMGIGISDTRCVQLNHLMANPPALGFVGDQKMGLSVVSILARKYGITVILQPVSNGTAVHILIPADLHAPAASWSSWSSGEPLSALETAARRVRDSPTDMSASSQYSPSPTNAPFPQLTPPTGAPRSVITPLVTAHVSDVGAAVSAEGLPMRLKGHATPSTGEDESSIGSSMTLGSTASAFAQGVTAGSAGTQSQALPHREPGTTTLPTETGPTRLPTTHPDILLHNLSDFQRGTKHGHTAGEPLTESEHHSDMQGAPS